MAVPPSALSSSVVLLVTVPASMETVAGVTACGSYPIRPCTIVYACAGLSDTARNNRRWLRDVDVEIDWTVHVVPQARSGRCAACG
jgi:hypothetical protein